MHDQRGGPVATFPSPSDTPEKPTLDPKITTPDSHARLRTAADQHQYAAAIGYGQQIYDGGNAGPDDLLIVAQSYFSMGDCPNTLIWVDRAGDAFHAAASEPGENWHRM